MPFADFAKMPLAGPLRELWQAKTAKDFGAAADNGARFPALAPTG